MPTTAVVIEDDAAIRRVVRTALLGELERVLECATAADGVDLVAAARPAVVILDLGLPDADGLQLCREIREWSAVPIVVLSAQHSEREKVALLDAGADDYVTKPFGTAELVARVRAVLRRATRDADAVITFGDFVMNVGARTLTVAGRDVHLTPIEWELLRTFVTQAGRTLTHQQIFNAVWGRAFGDPQQYLRVHVANLRRKIETDPVRPQLIVTEPGVGYRFELPR